MKRKCRYKKSSGLESEEIFGIGNGLLIFSNACGVADKRIEGDIWRLGKGELDIDDDIVNRRSVRSLRSQRRVVFSIFLVPANFGKRCSWSREVAECEGRIGDRGRSLRRFWALTGEGIFF